MVPSTLPLSPSTPSTSAAANVSAHRTCPCCTRRTSSLKYDKHSLCVACRDVQCSERHSWSTGFMLGYVKHKLSLVSKGKKKSSSSSPSVPVTAVTTAPVVSLPSLPVSTDDQLRSNLTSVLANLLSQSGQLGTNIPFTAPPAVLDSAPVIRGGAGGLGSDTPMGVPTTESPGVVLPTTQGDLPPPNVSVCVNNVASSRVSSLGGSLVTGLSQSHMLTYGTDQFGVAPYVNVASALSPGSLLFPFSDCFFLLFLFSPLLSRSLLLFFLLLFACLFEK